MTCTPSLAARSARASPTRRFRSSDSTTHGPAMRNGEAPPKCDAMSVVPAGQLGWGRPPRERRTRALIRPVLLAGRAHEAGEQRVRPRGTGLELRVELAADKPGVIGELDHFPERAVRRQAGAAHPILREHVAVGVRHLVAVPMALADLERSIRLGDPGAGAQLAWVRAQPHGPAQLLDALLRAHQRDHGILAFGCEFARVRVGEFDDVPHELDDRGLQAEADAEERELVFPRPANRLEHAFDAAHAESAWHQ